MPEILVGTAGWTDKTLLASGWYPAGVDTPQRRLAYYASQFPMVEVDSTYYAPPAQQTVQLWADRTPAGFVFSVKAFSMLTGHPTGPRALFADLRPQTDKKNLYPGDLAPYAYEQVWDRFLSAMQPLHQAGKLGLLHFGFPPWFVISRANKQYLLEVAKRCRPLPVAIELRHHSWFRDDNQAETLEFLAQHRLPYVCVDMPQGYPSSVPPLAVATGDLAVFRFHGHSRSWTSRSVLERFDYLYSTDELRGWAPKIEAVSREVPRTFVVMNNCRGDQAQRNATQFLDLLRPPSGSV